MKCTHIPRDSADYPGQLELYLTKNPPATVSCTGALNALAGNVLALFCSSRCPGTIVDKTYDLAQSLRNGGQTVVSGFHSPLEKECLNVLLRSPHSVVVCPPRGLATMRLPSEWQRPLREARLLLLSPFEESVRRPTAKHADERNRFAAALADATLIAHAGPGSKLLKLARTVKAWGKPLYTLPNPANEQLLALGAQPWVL
jgi:predicted Rossmann fold nucleotide-binding protein DprA/Smf involved in DNA uptake